MKAPPPPHRNRFLQLFNSPLPCMGELVHLHGTRDFFLSLPLGKEIGKSFPLSSLESPPPRVCTFPPHPFFIIVDSEGGRETALSLLRANEIFTIFPPTTPRPPPQILLELIRFMCTGDVPYRGWDDGFGHSIFCVHFFGTSLGLLSIVCGISVRNRDFVSGEQLKAAESNLTQVLQVNRKKS